MGLRWLLVLGLVGAATSSAVAAPRLALLAPENLTDSSEISAQATRQLLAGLRQAQVDCVDMAETRSALRAARIRSVGQISRAGDWALRDACDATHVLAWSILFYQENPPYETTLSARLIDSQSAQILGAWNLTESTGEGLDWIGEHTAASREETARLCVERLVATVATAIAEPAPQPRVPEIAVIGLDAWTRDRRDPVRASRLLVSALHGAGWRVVEPGEVADTLIRSGWSAQGSIAEEPARGLGHDLGVRWVLTGSIDTFTMGSGPHGESPPHLGCGLRLLRALDARPIWATERDANGADESGLFGHGRCPTLGGLAQELFTDIAEHLPKTASR